MFNDRNDVVHSHGKTSPEGSTAERQEKRIKENISGDCKRRRNNSSYPYYIKTIMREIAIQKYHISDFNRENMLSDVTAIMVCGIIMAYT